MSSFFLLKCFRSPVQNFCIVVQSSKHETVEWLAGKLLWWWWWWFPLCEAGLGQALFQWEVHVCWSKLWVNQLSRGTSSAHLSHEARCHGLVYIISVSSTFSANQSTMERPLNEAKITDLATNVTAFCSTLPKTNAWRVCGSMSSELTFMNFRTSGACDWGQVTNIGIVSLC